MNLQQNEFTAQPPPSPPPFGSPRIKQTWESYQKGIFCYRTVSSTRSHFRRLIIHICTTELCTRVDSVCLGLRSRLSLSLNGNSSDLEKSVD